MDNPDINFTHIDRDSTSLWFRPLRQLLEDRKPLPRTTILTFELSDNLNLPFGALCITKKKRVVFWPALPKELKLFDEGNTTRVTDHITLESPSGKIHTTGYLNDGSSEHHRKMWQLKKFKDNNYAQWFIFCIRKSVLENQENSPEREISMPSKDSKRRLDEFHKYTQQLIIQPIKTPTTNNNIQYFCTAIYIKRDHNKQNSITQDMFTLPNLPEGVIENLPTNELVPCEQTPFTIGDQNFIIVTTTPPGTLKEEYFGFPTTNTCNK